MDAGVKLRLAMAAAARGLPWILRQRRVVPAGVDAAPRQLGLP
jgi:hypothetical protein